MKLGLSITHNILNYFDRKKFLYGTETDENVRLIWIIVWRPTDDFVFTKVGGFCISDPRLD